MLDLKKIAITGGIASGKTTVCRFLAEFGAYVINADEIVHQLLIPKTSLGKKIINLLGRDIVVNDQFDRQLIAKKVFENYNLLKNLEGLLHPEVQEEIEKHYRKAHHHFASIPHQSSNKQTFLFVVEVPLLFEAGFEKNYDLTVLVTAPLDQCRERFIKKNPNDQEFQKRTARLISQEEKVKLADRIVSNDGSLEDLKIKTKSLFEELIS